MLVYKIFGLPGFVKEGLIFNSCVENLQGQPDLWLDECPYLYPRSSTRQLEGLRVELVSSSNAASAPPPLRWAQAA
ncbi:hypothetical protein [Hydrogenophaga sp. 2FB]|uniref:hypothetical protein n=1 Tax=Hydrogenophaga sp. 2FB TaxID=2502187 RepID=UPI0010F80A2D|nr:hypothetical protein [Hydrogenophaga sp. 2FB]